MKKIICLLSALILFCALSGCDKTNNASSQLKSETLILSDTELSINVGETVPLLAKTDNVDDIKWESSDDTIAKFFDGEVLAKNVGTCTITATLPSGKNAVCKISVNSKIIDSGECGENATWTYYEDGTLEISGIGEMKEYYNAYNLSAEINKNGERLPWERYNQTVKYIYVKDGITKISRYAFLGATSVLSIKIADSVKTIEYGAFSRTNCAEIIIPKTITEVGAGIFRFSKSRIYFEFDESYLNNIVNKRVEQYSLADNSKFISDIDWNASFEGEHYFYSETQKDGCWHYVDGKPTLW